MMRAGPRRRGPDRITLIHNDLTSQNGDGAMTNQTHRYRIRIGNRLWVHSLRLTKRGRIAHVALTQDKALAVVFESTAPKWAASKFDQAARNAFEVEFGTPWSEFHFVEAK